MINKPAAIESFLDNLRSADIYEKLNHSLDSLPDQNYDLMIKTIAQLKEKHLPNKLVKFNRHKHKDKNWITYSIINSIKVRDKKYHKLKCMDQNDPEYMILKHNLKVYNGILKRLIRETKAEYYQKTFETYRYDIKKHMESHFKSTLQIFKKE